MITVETKTTKTLEDLTIWSLLKNIMKHYPQMSHYINSNNENDAFVVSTDFSLTSHVFKTKTDIFDIVDIENLNNYLIDGIVEGFETITVTP